MPPNRDIPAQPSTTKSRPSRPQFRSARAGPRQLDRFWATSWTRSASRCRCCAKPAPAAIGCSLSLETTPGARARYSSWVGGLRHRELAAGGRRRRHQDRPATPRHALSPRSRMGTDELRTVGADGPLRGLHRRATALPATIPTLPRTPPASAPSSSRFTRLVDISELGEAIDPYVDFIIGLALASAGGGLWIPNRHTGVCGWDIADPEHHLEVMNSVAQSLRAAFTPGACDPPGQASDQARREVPGRHGALLMERQCRGDRPESTIPTSRLPDALADFFAGRSEGGSRDA